jgi:hypothetical protein
MLSLPELIEVLRLVLAATLGVAAVAKLADRAGATEAARDPHRCRHAGTPLPVAARPALHAARLPQIRVSAPSAVRRAVAVALATVADAQAATEIAPIPIPVSALRGGTYVPTAHGLRIVRARVVTDAVASGTQTVGSRVTVTRLRLSGPAVGQCRLTIRSTPTTTRIRGTVGGRRIALRVTTP